MSGEWAPSVMASGFKGMDDAINCCRYKAAKLLKCGTNVIEVVLERIL